AQFLNMDRIALRQKNLIRKEQFPYTIPSGSTYDPGAYHTSLAKAPPAIDYPALVSRRDAARQAGLLAGIGISTCLEPSGGNSAFQATVNTKKATTTQSG